MPATKELYHVLEEMVECARNDDVARVSELNRSFETLARQAYPDPFNIEYSAYDNCRQSCLLIKEMRHVRAQFVKDAIERFRDIPKP